MVKATRTEVKEFLTRVRKIINTQNGFHLHLKDRKKNMDALTEYNIPIESAKFFIEYLEVKHYWKGPESDDKDEYDHDWWFFGREIDSSIFYIKIRIKTKGNKQVVCLSFHPAKYPITNFPYK